MKANELRIGNVVNDAKNNPCNVIRISGISFSFGVIDIDIFDSKRRMLREDLKRLSPIPLTEEWLLKFGFYKIRVREYEKGDMSIYCGKKTISINVGFCNECGGYEIKVEIKYVHQLQNLYFALTGEELKLNETKP